MNIFFGMVSAGLNERFDRMKERIESDLGIRVSTSSNPGRTICCGYHSDGGVVLGKAETEDHCLILSGILQKPLPLWEHGSPIDDPDVTAAYLLSRYLKEGREFLDGITGQYVVALNDFRKSRVYLGCDSGGYRRIFYRSDKDLCVYSSHLVLLNAAFESGLDVDRSLEDFLLGYEFLPWNRTIFKGVSYPPPATLLECIAGEIHAHKIKNNPPDESALLLEKSENSGEEELVRLLHDEFMRAVEALCPSTDRVAVLLGGFDSALVASALTRLGKKVETFSFYFEDNSFNQAHTDTLSEFCGTKHTWVKITPQVILNGLSDYAKGFNFPAAQAHYLIQTAHICSVIREQGHFHCLTGDGCDEVFLGYPTVHRRAKLFSGIGVLPALLVRFLLYAFHWRFFERHLGHAYRLARNVIHIAGQKMPVRGHITNRIFDEMCLDRLRLKTAPLQEKSASLVLEELARGLDHLSSIRLAYHGKSSVGLNKNKVEGCSNISGLGIQSPFQHPGLVALARALPDNLLRPEKKTRSEATGKYILMLMAERSGLLPPEIIYQKKASPVSSPVDCWYREQLREPLIKLTDGLPFHYDKSYVREILKPKWLEKIYGDHFTLGRYMLHAISLLITYASFTAYGRGVHKTGPDADV
jgi:asparagine synthetase B (glutamine-hydrolysing)